MSFINIGNIYKKDELSLIINFKVDIIAHFNFILLCIFFGELIQALLHKKKVLLIPQSRLKAILRSLSKFKAFSLSKL